MLCLQTKPSKAPSLKGPDPQVRPLSAWQPLKKSFIKNVGTNFSTD